jgi:hypothetical protein
MMNRHLCAAPLALFLFFPIVVLAQPATRPASAAPPPAMPVVDYINVPLDEVIKLLNHVGGPSFQAVLAGGVQNHYPLVTLHLRDVTPEQVLRVMEKQLGLGVEPAGNPPIYVVSFPSLDNNPPAPTFHVTAYCLTPIIDQLLMRRNLERQDANPTTQSVDEAAKNRKAAMNDVVTVVQTAAKIAPDQATATMIEVHEPTEMLILKGTPEQREAAEGVLRALEPRPGTVVKGQGMSRSLGIGGGGGGGGK